MGNQQAAFYYSLNYEGNNDSGFFDDEVFDAEAKKPVEIVKAVENEDVQVDGSDFKTLGKQFPKSKSIEIVKKEKSRSVKRAIDLKPDIFDEKIEDALINKPKPTLPMRILKENADRTVISVIKRFLFRIKKYIFKFFYTFITIKMHKKQMCENRLNIED